MKSFKTLRSILEQKSLRDNIRKHLWNDYKSDSHYPAHVTHPGHMDDEDHDEFEGHVDDVHQHAKKHQISNPRKAIDSYTDSIRSKHTPSIH